MVSRKQRDLGTGALSTARPGQKAAVGVAGLETLDPVLRRAQGSDASLFTLQELLKCDMNIYDGIIHVASYFPPETAAYGSGPGW
jgi:hypothetical protein